MRALVNHACALLKCSIKQAVKKKAAPGILGYLVNSEKQSRIYLSEFIRLPSMALSDQ